MDVPRKRPVDVLVDTLEMCHRLEFGDRLALSTPTLPVADLLLSKLQVVKINRKDVLDALVLLAEHPLRDNDGARTSTDGEGAINLRRITSITSNDWGWWRTVTGNLDKLGQYLATDVQEGDLDVGRADPARSGGTGQGAPRGHRRRARSRADGASGRGSATG